MKKYDLICVGHVVVDLYFKADNFTFEKDRFQLALGGKYFSDEFRTLVGGGGANVAIGARKCGLKVGLIAKIGQGPFKKIIAQRLKQVGISQEMCIFEKDYANVSVILMKGAGERTVINYEKHQQSMLKKKNQIRNFARGRALYMGNLLDIELKERVAILKYVKEKKVLTFLNLGASDCDRSMSQLRPLIALTDVLIQNTHEFAQLVKTPRTKINFEKNIVKQYPLFAGKTVVITDGAHGSYGYTQKETFHVGAFQPKKIIDTTGAGDGYTAGFLASYLKNYNLYLAMRRGAYYAGRKLAHFGAN